MLGILQSESPVSLRWIIILRTTTHRTTKFPSPSWVTCRYFSIARRRPLINPRPDTMSTQASTSAFTAESFDAFNNQLQANALKATRNALALPTDIPFHRSMDSSFSQDLDAFSSRVLSLANNLLSLVATADTTQSARAKGKAKLEDQDDVVDNFHSLVVDSMDQLLERTVSHASLTCFSLPIFYRTYAWTNISAEANHPLFP